MLYEFDARFHTKVMQSLWKLRIDGPSYTSTTYNSLDFFKNKLE